MSHEIRRSETCFSSLHERETNMSLGELQRLPTSVTLVHISDCQKTKQDLKLEPTRPACSVLLEPKLPLCVFVLPELQPRLTICE